MSNAIDVPRLIAEVQKRPAIWDGRQKARQYWPKLWQEVATNIGTDDVKQCKRKWKNLRDAYHAEVRRYLRRHENHKLRGAVKPHVNNCKSKWVYFPSLTFLNESKQFTDYSIDNGIPHSDSNVRNHSDDTADNSCSMPEQNFHSGADIKLEPSHYIEINADFNEAHDADTANDLSCEEFESIATPQGARRLFPAFSKENTNGKNAFLEQQNTVSSPVTSPKCKCSQSSDEQVQFLQDLGREEQTLMTSTRQDIIRCNKLDHIGDFDYNFLVSFLPQMKKMSELQNLRFRAKMSETVLNILTDTTNKDTSNTCGNQPILC